MLLLVSTQNIDFTCLVSTVAKNKCSWVDFNISGISLTRKLCCTLSFEVCNLRMMCNIFLELALLRDQLDTKPVSSLSSEITLKYASITKTKRLKTTAVPITETSCSVS
jgi:hypothetical protein